MNITITGNLGSGKTSVCRELEKAGFSVISAGDIFRGLAQEKGMTVIELNEAAKSDRSIDDMLDRRSTELGKTMDHTVFDSRLAWHFVEESFKVFLLVDTQEAARRVFEGDSRSAEIYQNLDEAGAGLKERADLEQARFKELYGLDYYDACNYDLIIESSYAAPDQIAREIIRNYELYQQKPFSAKVELNLKSLYPAEKAKDAEKRKSNGAAGQMEDILIRNADNEKDCPPAVSVAENNGYYYLSEGSGAALAALAAGKHFAEVEKMQVYADARNLIVTKHGLEQFEQAGNFKYRFNPLETPVKAGYMADFSHVFHL